MAKNGIKIVEKALDKGFKSKGAKVYLVTEKSDYKDFIRMFVVSDFFRSKTNKERLGEIFSMLEENGAKGAIAKISLCVAMTNREYDREFGEYTWLGRPADNYREMKRKPRVARLSRVRSTS
ncbi:MAG TPA: hypothetical protein VKM93_23745 [Terriglobia bacterium]|nr:hypothetical protein [Terriglobia bacterium]